mmetsp:Transcript_42855/g.115543  ORF Transcript_42855/g.115543 Transcript_42855/m.115543 type:complete len:219 (-) Transcript_42855:93-749(-)
MRGSPSASAVRPNFAPASSSGAVASQKGSCSRRSAEKPSVSPMGALSIRRRPAQQPRATVPRGAASSPGEGTWQAKPAGFRSPGRARHFGAFVASRPHSPSARQKACHCTRQGCCIQSRPNSTERSSASASWAGGASTPAPPVPLLSEATDCRAWRRVESKVASFDTVAPLRKKRPSSQSKKAGPSASWATPRAVASSAGQLWPSRASAFRAFLGSVL